MSSESLQISKLLSPEYLADVDKAILAMKDQLSSSKEKTRALEERSKALISIVNQKLARCPTKTPAVLAKNPWEKSEDFFLQVTSVYCSAKELARCSLVCKRWKESMEGNSIILKRQLKDMHPEVYSLIGNTRLTPHSLNLILKTNNSLKAVQAAIGRAERARRRAEDDENCTRGVVCLVLGVGAIVGLPILLPAGEPLPSICI